MASCGNQCRVRATPILLSGAGTRTKHCAVAKVKEMIKQEGADGQMKEEIQPEQFYMVPELYEAASKGDIKYFNDLSVANQTPNAQHEDQKVINIPPKISRTSCLSQVTYSGDTVLHIAARFGQIEVARWICEAGGSDLLIRSNDKKETPLHYAAQSGNLDLVQYFIRLASQKGTNITKDDFLQKRNKYGETALYHAVRHEHKEVVEEFMRTDIQLASTGDSNNVSPLYLATVQSSRPIVTTLVRYLKGKNVPREAFAGPDRRTVLHAAAIRNKFFIEQILSLEAEEIKYTADNIVGIPLHYAVSVNNVGAVKVLLKEDITSAYVTNNCGLFPVHMAAKLGHVEVLIELFKQCPDSDELLDDDGKNFIHLAVEEKKEAVVQWVCQNAKSEKAINTLDKKGNTPLHLAVKAKDKATFGLLILSRRAQFSWVNNDGMTPLYIADAQRKDAFLHWKNPENVIYRTLGLVGCPQGIERTAHAKQENSQKKEEENEKQEEERYETMAKSMSLGSVLIASAAFAAAFAVSGTYIKSRDLYNTPHLNMAFKVFVVMDAYAFLCSIIATCLLIEAALNFVDPAYRKRYLIQFTALVMMAARGFIMAFTVGVYVILTPVSRWLAIIVVLTGAVGPAVIQPHQWPSWLVMRTMSKYMGWKGLLRRNHHASGKISAKPQTLRDSISLFESRTFILSIFTYFVAVIWVLTDGLFNFNFNSYSEINQSRSFYSLTSEDIILFFIILLLVPSCFLPVYSIVMEKHLKPSKKVQCIL